MRTLSENDFPVNGGSKEAYLKRLKPRDVRKTYGTAEAVPLSKTDFRSL